MSTPRDESLTHVEADEDRPFDILIKSSQNSAQSGVPAHSQYLARGSNVFKSMLELGAPGSASVPSFESENQLPVVEVNERHEVLVLLINFLETPPAFPPSYVNNAMPSSPVPRDNDSPGQVLPWPLLTTLLDLADKYEFSDNTLALLHAHLQSHASSYPLQVYALASRLELGAIASLASSFLLHPPMHRYSVSDIKILPSATTYHLLLVLQTHRLQKLKEIVTDEPLFPHDYGACPKHGTAIARSAWEGRKAIVLEHVNAGSLVADMMDCDEDIKMELKHCVDCCLGWERAVEMMRYKAGKVPREITQLPTTALD